MQPSWNNITVQQYQEVFKLSMSKDIDGLEKVYKAIAILYNMTESQAYQLSIPEINKKSREIKFILTAEEIPGKPVKQIKVNGNKYAVPYKVTDLSYGQYIDILHFSEKPVENMHYILARLVNPVKWGFIKQKNKSDDIHKVAEEMLNARVIDLYHSCVFFCKVFTGSIKAMEGYLIAEMTKENKMTAEEAKTLLNYSIESMGGFTTANGLKTSLQSL